MQNVIAINAAAQESIIAAQATSDEMLLDCIAGGDRNAMHIFYCRHNIRVYRFVLRIVRDNATAEDLVSQAFLDVWRTAGTTVLMVTHDVEEALFLSQRTYVLSSHPGRVKREITVPFSAEERHDRIRRDERFLDLRDEVRGLLLSEVVEV
jgi:hypothetical protein